MTVAELEASMPHHEFVEWWAYHARKAQQRELHEMQARRGGR